MQSGVESEVKERPLDSGAWYAVYTKHQHEKTASNLLERKGFEVFLPLYHAQHRWRDRVKVVSLPLFSCYVFLRTTLERKLDILRTPGIFWLVENAGHACAIPEAEIETVRRMAQSPAKIEPHPYLQCGDYVRVREGALTGIEGILTRVKNRYRVVVCVELLQKAVAVEVDLASLEPASRAKGSGSKALGPPSPFNSSALAIA